jgi:hypothetical protein
MNFSPNSKALRELKAKLVGLTNVQFEAAIGLILGDVSIQSQNKGKTYRLKFEWGDINKDYAFHVYDLFKEWILTEPKAQTRINSNGNEVLTWRFQTFSHEAFNPLAELFLSVQGKKMIKDGLIRDHLTPRGLAYWFCDDGGKLDYSSNKGKGIVFNTHSFTEAEVRQMCTELEAKFGFVRQARSGSWLKLNKGKPTIAISGWQASYEQFLDYTSPFIFSTMRAKLPSPRSSNTDS